MVSKYWLPTGTCHSISGNEVSVCMRLMNASQRVKFGNTTLLRSHQWTLDAAPYHAASWSATSLKITSHGVMPEGLPTSPAFLMKAMTLSASAAGSTVERWSVAMSTLLAQLLAWMASKAFGAYLSRSFKKARPIPATVFGSPVRSALPELGSLNARRRVGLHDLVVREDRDGLLRDAGGDVVGHELPGRQVPGLPPSIGAARVAGPAAVVDSTREVLVAVVPGHAAADQPVEVRARAVGEAEMQPVGWQGHAGGCSYGLWGRLSRQRHEQREGGQGRRQRRPHGRETWLTVGHTK